ncbi:LysR family transcriptional regulator [Roseovarius sp. CAU 1744]|uniref:LysR family transcriptional regulator n=1 Tax=Roseovarius sp. CAU 1744 TaxID=3140368 RepID=UPI00325BBC5E
MKAPLTAIVTNSCRKELDFAPGSAELILQSRTAGEGSKRKMASTRITNWNLLHTFVVIAEQQSLSKAATVLGRGQPAVSAALKNLEDQLNCELAHRGPKEFKLTEAGITLYQEARDICNSIERVSGQVSDVGNQLKGTVNVALASHMISPILDQVFVEFHDSHPDVSFSMTVLRIPEILDRIGRGLNSFGIAPISKKRSDLDYFHLYREYCGFYCGPRHKFFGRTDLTIADLEGEKAVTYPSAVFSDELQSIADMRKQMKFADPFAGVSNNTEELLRLIVAGLGIGPIPIHVAEREVGNGLLWRLPPYENSMEIDVFLITNPQVQPNRSERAFVHALRDIVDGLTLEERTYP